jgi:hypothetical protein
VLHIGPDDVGELEAEDRVRLTKRNASTFGLSVRRHTGRSEEPPEPFPSTATAAIA